MEEVFNEEQKRTLEKYVTNTTDNVFVLKNLPEVIKGALFSRYSRSTMGLRSLLLKEFITNNEETAFNAIVSSTIGDNKQAFLEQQTAIKKAQAFYDRILDGYGDDSIGELGGAHLAIENVSMLAAKMLEDSRIGGSPLEKSTRYIYFDQQVNGQYLFYREPILMTSAYRDAYVNTCNMLFDTYTKLIPPLTEKMESSYPPEEGITKGAYRASIRAKVCDTLRGLLPAGTLTNMGIYGNGRFFEMLLHKLHCQNLVELQDIGKSAYEELAKAIPSFVRRSEISHRTHIKFAEYFEALKEKIELITSQHAGLAERSMDKGVHLLSWDPDAVVNVAAAILYNFSDRGLGDLRQYCQQLPEEEIARILEAACDSRENRRHKSPRALEHAYYTFEILSDFGAYRDLHRHRMLTQERQYLSCDYGYDIPSDIINTEMEKPYREALDRAGEVYDKISHELREEAQYVVPMAYRVRYYFNVNLRALQWLCELRSTPAGHTSYREIAQSMAKEIIRVHPQFERFFKFVDYENHDLGRLGQEQRQAEKLSQLV